ncbi:unnamed protein product [Somion occarium]|uniref:Methyltransferase domain-containing protein n=1 Tax=Somion occarium TaxID=3059160 RepID=A0ABP1CP92_9APHY
MHPSAQIYTKLVLKLYDFIVLSISNGYAWRCPTQTTLLPFSREHAGGEAHLDVGVGTGYYPANAVTHLARTEEITFVDLNPDTLEVAESRLREAGYKGRIETLEHDVFLPLPTSMHKRFDSVSLFYLLHCLPGSFPAKSAQVLHSLIPAMTDDATLYGATILGEGVEHNWLGQKLMDLYNAKGVFSNIRDSQDKLLASLKERFEEVEIRLVGVVALFVARQPIRRVE